MTVIDYGIGNIFSVVRALKYFEAEVKLTDKPQDILSASSLVLPGVGAFLNGMRGLCERGLIDPLREYAASGRPLLGICLGMQMLFTESTEFGRHDGLNIIKGKIIPIEPLEITGASFKVPHIGWSELIRPQGGREWGSSILKYISEKEYCYFIHSFTAIPDDEGHRLSDTYYGNFRISAAVAKENVYGCQFHPEKSGITGLKIIKGFLEINA